MSIFNVEIECKDTKYKINTIALLNNYRGRKSENISNFEEYDISSLHGTLQGQLVAYPASSIERHFV